MVRARWSQLVRSLVQSVSDSSKGNFRRSSRRRSLSRLGGLSGICSFTASQVEVLELRYVMSAVSAVADSFQVQERAMMSTDPPVVLNVLNNDSSTGGAMTIISVQTPAHGSVSIQHDPMAAMYAMYGMPPVPDTLVFTAPNDFSGVETFTYTVTNAAGDQGTATVTMTITSVLQVTSLNTNSGSTTGGTSVTINGSGFDPATQVLFGDTAATAFTINSDSSITATAPAHASGSVNVQVITPAGSSGMSMFGQFNYVYTAPSGGPTVTQVSPGTESIAGGDSITITGTGFTYVMSVTFGGTAASSYMVMSDTTIMATAPAHAAGSADVQVMTMSGTSAINSSDVLQYTAPVQQPPVVTALTTSSGTTEGGTSVGIQGSNFTNVTAVWFGEQQATSFVVNSTTSITAVTPAHAVGSVNVQVVTSAGTSGTSMSQFNYVVVVPAPTVTQVSPGTENITGGDTITITGTGFTNATAVTFGGTAASSFTVVSATSITAVAPAHAAGQIDVQVTTAGGTSLSNASDHLQYLNSTSGGGGGSNNSSVTDWQSALAQSAANYQHSIDTTKADYDSRMQEISAATEAARIAREAANAALRAASDSELTTALASIKAATDAAAAVRDQELEDLQAALATESLSTDETYAHDYQAAIDEAAATLTSLNQQFASDISAIESEFTSVSAAAQGVLDSSLAGISATATAAIGAATNTYNSAKQSAAAGYQSATASAQSTLQSSQQANVNTYNSALASATATLNSQLSGTGGGTAVTTNFDAGVIGANAAYQAAVYAAETAFATAMTAVANSYNTTMAIAGSAYDTAMTGADAAFVTALNNANDAFTTATNNAFSAYHTAVTNAVDAFDQAVIQLQTDFDTTSDNANQAFQTATGTADTAYNKAIADAQKAYDDLVNPAQTTYNNFRATASGALNTAIIGAANSWILEIWTAEQAYPGAINGANTAHAGALTAAIQALAGMGPSGIAGDASAAMNAVQGVADSAKQTFQDAISAPLGVTDMAAYTQAWQTRQNDAVLAYLDTVVGKLVSEAGTLRTKYSGYLDSTYDAINSAVTDTGAADVTLATAVKTAEEAIEKAKEAGQARFMQALADLEDGAYEAAENAEIAYRKVLATAQDQRTTANAAGRKAQSLAYSAAGVAYVDAISEAQKTYVDDYEDDWDTMETAFDDAAEDLAHSVATADEDFVTAADLADDAWVTTAETAATTYNTAADTAATTANSSYHSAVEARESAIEAAWTAAVNAEYPNAPDAAAYIAAQLAYDASVLSAWEAADAAAVALDNANADAMVTASNAALTAEANAAHAADKAGVDAEVQAMIAAADAQRDYDTAYVDAAVKNAKDTIEKKTKNAEDTAAAKQKENDKQAAAYLDAITKADTLHETTVLKANDAIQQAADDFLKTSFASAKALQVQAENNANTAAADAIAEATADATALKDRLIAHTKSETARLKAAALKSFDDAIANAQKQLADLHSGPTSDLNPYQMTASNGTIPFGNLTMMVLGIDGVRSNLKQVATNVLSNLALAGTMMGSGALINTTPGTDAAGLMQQLLGMTSLRVTITSDSGIFVGSYDLLSDAVYRAVTQADGSVKTHSRSKADVDALLGSGMTADGWNTFFGGINGPPDPKTVMHRAINWVIDDAKLQAPGGLASDIMLTAQVVTEVTGIIDPTGLSDAVNGSICLAQGDNLGAAIAFGSIAVPFGAEKIAKAASRVPVNSLDNVVKGIETSATGAKKTISNGLETIADAGASQTDTIGKLVPCPAGSTKCFVAGTQIIMQSSEFPLPSDDVAMTAEEPTIYLDESVVNAVLAVGLGVGFAIVKSKLDTPAGRRLPVASGRPRRLSELSETDEPVTLLVPTSLPIPDGEMLPATIVADVIRSESRVATPRRWLTKTLTAAMLVCFALGGWFASQSAFQTNGQANAASRATTATAAAISREPRYLSKNIEDVQKGDLVLARDQHGREIGYRHVVKTYRRTSDHLRHLKFRDRNGHDQSLQTTDEHPFFDAEANTFVNAGNLKEGAKVTGPDGHVQTLVLSQRVEHPRGVPVFNFQVEGFHTYYVHEVGASTSILVHNADYLGDVPALPPAGDGSKALDQLESISKAQQHIREGTDEGRRIIDRIQKSEDRVKNKLRGTYDPSDWE